MTFLAIEMNMIVKMLFCTAFPTAFREIHNTVNVNNLMNKAFIFKSFKHSVNRHSIA